MPHLRTLLVIGACVVSAGRPASAQRDSSTVPPARSLAEAQTRFRAARRPTASALVGHWVAVNGIMLDKRSSGERIERRSGARRDDIAGRPFDWVFDISRGRSGYRVKHQNPWVPTGDVSTIRFRKSDITFEKEDGSDTPVRYRCRVWRPGYLVCLNADGDLWDVREFAKSGAGPA